MRPIFLFVFSIICFVVFPQQQPEWKEIKEIYGLPSNKVFKRLEAHNGGAWFATENGLAFFDGYVTNEVQLVLGDSNYSKLPVYNIETGPDKNLWLATKSGLLIYNPQLQELINHKLDDNRPVEKTLFINDNRVLISYYHGFYDVKLNSSFLPESVIDYPLSDLTEQENCYIHTFYVDQADQLYISIIGKGVYKGPLENLDNWYQFKKIKYSEATDSSDFIVCQEITSYDPQLLLFNYVKEGLYLYNVSQDKFIPVKGLNYLDSPSFSTITRFTLLNNKELYFTQIHSGLQKADLSDLNKIKTEQYSFKSIPDFNFWDNPVSSIQVKNNILWLTTIGEGIKYAVLNNPGINIHSLKDYLPQKTFLYAVKAIGDDQVWVGSYGNGLLKVDIDKNNFESIKNFNLNNNALNLPSDSINDIYISSRNELWIATTNGLALYNNGEERMLQIDQKPMIPDKVFNHSSIKTNSISSNNVNYIFEDKGNTIYLTSSSGINIYQENGSFLNHFNNNGLPILKYDKDIYFSDFLSDGSLVMTGDWIAGWFKDHELLSYQQLFNTDNRGAIYHSINDEDNISWLGTSRGLLKYDGKSGKTIDFKGKAYFANKKVNAIIKYSDHLWLGTNQGLFAYNTKTGAIHSFDLTESEGWPYFHYGSVDANSSNIFFGTNKGIVVIDPVKAIKNTILCEDKCNIFLSTITKNQNQSVNPEVLIKGNTVKYDPVTIDYGDIIDLRLGFPTHHVEKGAHLQYSISDSVWVDIGLSTPRVLLHNLSPGEYPLEFRALSVSGEEISNASMNLTVLPPVYLRWWALGIYLSLAVAIVFVGVKSKINTVKRKEKDKQDKAFLQKKQEINDLKFQFISNISHEFRTPLTLMLNDIQSLKNKVNEEGATEKLEINAKRLKRLANEMLDLKGLNTEKLKLTVGEYDVVEFIKSICSLFEGLAQDRSITFKIDSVKPSIDLWFNPHQFEKVVYNLLSNAFKFTPEGGSITVEINKVENCAFEHKRLLGLNNCITIEVKDSGPGISVKDLESIFSPDYSNVPSEPTHFDSSGIGLYLCRKIVDLHFGDIKAENLLEGGASFLVRIPEGNYHYDRDQLELNKNKLAASGLKGVVKTETPILDLSNKIVLTIEDNEDINIMLQNILSPIYKHKSAKNGVEGLEKAKALIPDLVVTDISMPGKNGMVVIKELKSNPLLSHIPIIVLTSYADDERRVAVLNEGVDAFIRKPFDQEVLIARINNLLLSRQQLKDMFSDGSANFNDLVNQSPDTDLLKRTITLIDKHMDDPDFDVTALASGLKVSRSLLYNKIPSLTNYSPKDFIHVMRVRRAAKYLRTGRFRVNEVSDEVGYNTQKNFRKYFKNYFGVTPTDYLKNNS
ncbi:hybrid sensor histidine kinase/response regulator transcription factor [Marinigracilibium pacificum]|uniref:histidine kinase n=1 Tax=Marinigracilibium pacificum TaxID=2729599 RepID=A0A848IV61_9BACT|nr:response regulator [Marinigracilibium pacificum]NMM47121.1 response regulator [Marinigracilibium pacificum]